MDPKIKAITDREQTETLPAQEKVAHGDQVSMELTAEQVYAQRADESQQDGIVQALGFVP